MLALMCTTENVDGKEFTDDYVQEKYQHIVFAKGIVSSSYKLKFCLASPAQENLKLRKCSLIFPY